LLPRSPLLRCHWKAAVGGDSLLDMVRISDTVKNRDNLAFLLLAYIGYGGPWKLDMVAPV